MTTNRDFKKLVRARMAKTGESYRAARAQLEAAPQPTPDEYAELADISDASVLSGTGRDWAQWVSTLDALGARALGHADIAARVRADFPGIGSWWAQSVTVGYERIRGLREKGQLCTGDFAASRSRTFPVPVARLVEAFGDGRDAWIGTPTELRTASERSVRLTWQDGTVVSAWFTDKGPQKSSVAIQHQGLDSAGRREREKEAWGERLQRLGEQL